jgi:hypothetical protein
MCLGALILRAAAVEQLVLGGGEVTVIKQKLGVIFRGF